MEFARVLLDFLGGERGGFLGDGAFLLLGSDGDGRAGIGTDRNDTPAFTSSKPAPVALMRRPLHSMD